VEVPRTAVVVAGEVVGCTAVRVAKRAVEAVVLRERYLLFVPPPVEPSGGLLGFLVRYQIGTLVNRRDKSRTMLRRTPCRRSDTS